MNEAPAYVPAESPPTMYAIAAALEGEPGGWARVGTGAAQRAIFLAPGIWAGLTLAGAKPRFGEVASAAVVGSATITGFLFVLYAWKRQAQKQAKKLA